MRDTGMVTQLFLKQRQINDGFGLAQPPDAASGSSASKSAWATISTWGGLVDNRPVCSPA